MNAITTKLLKSVKFNNNVIWLVIVLFIAVITGIAIADEKWVYFGIVLIPFLVYLSIAKPFIFPFGAYVFLLPFDSVLSLMGSSEGATLTKLLGVLTILVLFLKGLFENKMKKPDAASILWILFIMYGFLSMWWAIEPEFVLNRLQTSMALLFLYLVVASYQLQKNEFETLKWCIVFGGLLASIIAIYNYGSIATGERTSLAFGERVTSLNKFSFSLIIPVSIAIEMVLKQKTKMMKGLFGIVFGVILFAVIISGSRGGMAAVAAVFIVYFLSRREKITFGVIMFVIGIVFMSLIPDIFFERWGKSVETGGAGRLDIWYVGWLTLKKYVLLGAGLSNFPIAYNEFARYAPTYQGLFRDPHNIYLGIFVELGIMGFSLMIFGIIKHYRLIKSRFNKCDVNHVMLKAAFWAILVACFFSTHIWTKSFWLIWMMILMCRNIIEDEAKEPI